VVNSKAGRLVSPLTPGFALQSAARSRQLHTLLDAANSPVVWIFAPESTHNAPQTLGAYPPKRTASVAKPYLLQLARGVHKRTAIQLPRPCRQHKSRALSHSATPGLCGVYLSGFVSSARRRPICLSRQLRASSRQSLPNTSIPWQDAYKKYSRRVTDSPARYRMNG
jgi:hypothetical protein